jgi:hypothetical protein
VLKRGELRIRNRHEHRTGRTAYGIPGQEIKALDGDTDAVNRWENLRSWLACQF